MNGNTPTGLAEERRTTWSGRGPGRDPSRRAPMRVALQIGTWGVLHFVFYFLQQLAELVSPLLLVAGIGWWALPHIVAAVTTSSAGNADSQVHDILNTISGAIPTGLNLAGHWITPGGLIASGLLMMALAAVGATLSALAARGM